MSVPSESPARHELIATALRLGIERPDAMSNEALTAAIENAAIENGEPENGEPENGEPENAGNSTGGWFSVARHLVAQIVEQGLNSPAAAKVLRAVGDRVLSAPRGRPPLPTVTLARIYMAQGHRERARTTLVAVLARHPDNQKAKELLSGLDREAARARPTRDSASPARDLVAVVQNALDTRVGWQLGTASTVLAQSKQIELWVRIVRPTPLGSSVSEQRRTISDARGVATFDVEPSASVCAALVACHGPALVREVASVFQWSGERLDRVSPVERDEAPALLSLARQLADAARDAQSSPSSKRESMSSASANAPGRNPACA